MLTLSIPDMSCSHCIKAVTKAVTAVDTAANVAVELETKTARIETLADRGEILKSLDEAGYPATVTS